MSISVVIMVVTFLIPIYSVSLCSRVFRVFCLASFCARSSGILRHRPFPAGPSPVNRAAKPRGNGTPMVRRGPRERQRSCRGPSPSRSLCTSLSSPALRSRTKDTSKPVNTFVSFASGNSSDWSLPPQKTADHAQNTHNTHTAPFVWAPCGCKGSPVGSAPGALELELSPALRARALHAAASTAFALGDYPAAEERWREALLLSQGEGDVLVEGNAWAGMGLVEMVRANHETAGSNWEKSIALHERCDEEYLASVSRVFLGTTLLARGEDERAKREFEGALASARRLKTPVLTYVALYNAAQSALARGDREEAARLLGEGIEWSGRIKDRAYLVHLLEASATLAVLGGKAEPPRCCWARPRRCWRRWGRASTITTLPIPSCGDAL